MALDGGGGLTARKAPVAERDQPMPLAGSRRKKGRGTSNHRSRAPNRKTRERERMLMLGLLLQGSGRQGRDAHEGAHGGACGCRAMNEAGPQARPA